MIRRFKIDDLDIVMKIWLESNIKAHDFISKSYWQGNYEVVKDRHISTEFRCARRHGCRSAEMRRENKLLERDYICLWFIKRLVLLQFVLSC
jgi:hypothetical protein